MKILLGLASVLCAVLAGFYFAYATVIVAQRGAADGADSMRRMNDAVERPLFLILFFLAPLLALAAAVCLVVGPGSGIDTALGVVGSLCAVAAFVSTIVVNVPLNSRLAEGVVEWSYYAPMWGSWNLVRTGLCAAAAVSLASVAIR